MVVKMCNLDMLRDTQSGGLYISRGRKLMRVEIRNQGIRRERILVDLTYATQTPRLRNPRDPTVTPYLVRTSARVDNTKEYLTIFFVMESIRGRRRVTCRAGLSTNFIEFVFLIATDLATRKPNTGPLEITGLDRLRNVTQLLRARLFIDGSHYAHTLT